MSLLRRSYATALEFVPSIFKIGKKLTDTTQRPEDIVYLKKMYDAITQWCVQNEFLILTRSGDRYVPNIASVSMDSRIRNYIHDLNLKQLHIGSHLDEALALFRDTEYDKTMTRLIDLHIQISVEIDPRFLNLYINKLLFVLMRYQKGDEEETFDWADIFAEYPYIWLLFPIQWIMRSAVPPNV